jgi:hypothetical protein
MHASSKCILGSLLIACSGEERPPIREQSDYLILRAPADLPVCEGTFQRMETEIIRIQAMFGAQPVTVDYSWMPRSHVSTDEFPCDTSGCALEADVYARTLMSTHELVHAARSDSLPSVLEEGVATLFQIAADRSADVMASREVLREALELGTWEAAPSMYALYERLAHFVSFLFAKYGKDAFIELERRVRWGQTAHRPLSQWQADFEAVYGESFEQVWESYATYPDCPPAQFHLPLTECSQLPTAPLDASLMPALLVEWPESQFTRVLDCDDAQVVGPIVFSNGAFMRSASYYVDLDNKLGGAVWIRLTGDVGDSSRAVITSCGNCWDGSAAFVSSSNTSAGGNMQSGRHTLILYQDLEATGEFGVELSF